MNFFMFMFLTSLCQILSQQTIKCWDFIITARCVYINQIMYIIITTLQEKLIPWSVCLSWNLFQTYTCKFYEGMYLLYKNAARFYDIHVNVHQNIISCWPFNHSLVQYCIFWILFWLIILFHLIAHE